MPLFPVRRDAASAAFFDGTRAGDFLVVRDTTTGEILSPRADASLDPDRYERVRASGFGQVVSWSVVHGRDADGPTRTVVGIVQLDEGPWWWAELSADPDAALLGARVRVEYMPSGPGERDEVVPVFAVA